MLTKISAAMHAILNRARSPPTTSQLNHCRLHRFGGDATGDHAFIVRYRLGPAGWMTSSPCMSWHLLAMQDLVCRGEIPRWHQSCDKGSRLPRQSCIINVVSFDQLSRPSTIRYEYRTVELERMSCLCSQEKFTMRRLSTSTLRTKVAQQHKALLCLQRRRSNECHITTIPVSNLQGRSPPASLHNYYEPWLLVFTISL